MTALFLQIMKPIFYVRIAVDISMAAILLFLLGWHLFGNFPHEILGTGLFVLFSIHNILNFRWYRSLFRGCYTVFRAVQTAVILLLWLCIVLTAASSLMISRDVWAFLDVPGAAVGRKIHLVATAWLFVLSGVHLGFHCGAVAAKLFRGFRRRTAAAFAVRILSTVVSAAAFAVRILSTVVSAAAAVYGAAAFVRRKLYSDLFLLSEFKFFDFEESPAVFLAEAVCMTVLFAVAGFCLRRLVTVKKRPSGSRRPF